MDEGEIIEDKNLTEIARDILENGDKVKDTSINKVYLGENYALSIPKSERTEQLQRLCTRVPGNLYPETYVRTVDTSESGRETVVLRERSDYSLGEALEDDGIDKLDDLVCLMDSLVSNNVAMVDPNPENFRYYGNQLKISDIADVESIESFPESYKINNPENDFKADVEEMFISAGFESSQFLDYSGEEVVEYLKDKSEFGDYLDTDEKVRTMIQLRDSSF